MILYLGSNTEIQKIDLSKSKPNKDFGKAFYLSKEKQQAEEMAAFTVDRFGGKPVITSFEFDEFPLIVGIDSNGTIAMRA